MGSKYMLLPLLPSFSTQFFYHPYQKLIVHLILKGQGHIFPLTCSAIYESIFVCDLPSFGNTSCRDFCLLYNIMGLYGALNVVLITPKKQCLFPEIMTLLLKIVL